MVTKKQQVVYNIKALLKQLHVCDTDNVQECDVENNSYVISGVHNLTLVLYDVVCTDDNHIPAHVTLYNSYGPYSEDVKESEAVQTADITSDFDLMKFLTDYIESLDDQSKALDVYELIHDTFK